MKKERKGKRGKVLWIRILLDGDTSSSSSSSSFLRTIVLHVCERGFSTCTNGLAFFQPDWMRLLASRSSKVVTGPKACVCVCVCDCRKGRKEEDLVAAVVVVHVCTWWLSLLVFFLQLSMYSRVPPIECELYVVVVKVDFKLESIQWICAAHFFVCVSVCPSVCLFLPPPFLSFWTWDRNWVRIVATDKENREGRLSFLS